MRKKVDEAGTGIYRSIMANTSYSHSGRRRRSRSIEKYNSRTSTPQDEKSFSRNAFTTLPKQSPRQRSFDRTELWSDKHLVYDEYSSMDNFTREQPEVSYIRSNK